MILYKLFDKNACAPFHSTDHAACYDLFLPNDIKLYAHEAKAVDLGIGFECPVGWHIEMWSRSSTMIKRGIYVQPSIIDWDYRGPIGALLLNITDCQIVLSAGERLVQIKPVQTLPGVTFIEATELAPTTRGSNGFGSTGK